MDIMRDSGNRIISLEATKRTLARKPCAETSPSKPNIPDPNTRRVLPGVVRSLLFFMVSAAIRITSERSIFLSLSFSLFFYNSIDLF